MISILHQSRQHVERRFAWPASWPVEVTSVASSPAGFARGFHNLHSCERAATSRAMSALVGLFQAGDDLAASLLICVFEPAIRNAARSHCIDVNDAAGELANVVGGHQLGVNAPPTVGSIAKDLRKRLVRRDTRDRRWRDLMLAHPDRRIDEEMIDVERRADYATLVDEIGLSPAERELLAREFFGQSSQECAAALGVHLTTVYKRRAALRRRFATAA